MIRSFVPLAAAVALSAGPALARDARLVTRAFDPAAVVTVPGRAGVQATIIFDADEHIENVAIGDSARWQVTPNKRANLLFVKPLGPTARTNMTVVTDRHTYLFDLVAGPRQQPLYVLRFTYPQGAKPASATSFAIATATTDEARAVAAPIAPALVNRAWTTRGAAKLAPAEIWDDGTATYLRWASGASLPAILVRSSAGVEGPVNYAVRDAVVVVDGVPDAIVLRSGKDAATLERAVTLAERR